MLSCHAERPAARGLLRLGEALVVQLIRAVEPVEKTGRRARHARAAGDEPAHAGARARAPAGWQTQAATCPQRLELK